MIDMTNNNTIQISIQPFLPLGFYYDSYNLPFQKLVQDYEVYNMTYQALLAGSKGIIYYTYSDST
jgi:hypothetical protein